MTVALSARRAALTPPWVKRSLWKAAREVPSWHIAPALIGDLTDLVAGQSLVTFTNSSPAWGFNSSGVLVQPAANVPFIEYDPATGSALGWRVWDAVTNSIRNNTMVGAVAGTPGTLPTNWATSLPAGVTRQVVGVGAVNGIEYIDIRFSGTPAITSNIQIKPDGNAGAIATTASQSWAISSWVAVVAGSTANLSSPRLVLNDYSAGPTYLRTTIYASNVLSAGSTFARVSGVNTTGASTTIVEPLFLFDVTSGLAVDITIRIGLPQLQQSATVGPVVKTSGLTASSTADVASITGAAFAGIVNTLQGTLYASASVPNPGSYSGFLVSLGTDFNNSVHALRQSDAQGVARIRTASVDQYLQGAGATWTDSSARAMAIAYSAASSNAAFQGALMGSDTAVTLPAMTTLSLGSLFGFNQFRGYIRELAIWKSRRPNANLQALTA